MADRKGVLPVLRDVSEPKAFWASITDAQKFELLADAPKKLAGPRVMKGDRASWRHTPGGQEIPGSYACRCTTCEKDTGKQLHHANVDARLVAQGWTLVPEKQQTSTKAEDCTCYRDCGTDSASGHWHQHADDLCPVHPDQLIVG